MPVNMKQHIFDDHVFAFDSNSLYKFMNTVYIVCAMNINFIVSKLYTYIIIIYTHP